MSELRNRTVLITGAASGLGLLVAQRVATHGARLVLWDVDTAALERVTRALQAAGHEASAYTCDLSSRSAIATTAKRVLTEQGAVDVLVNNAGIVSGKPLLEASDEAIERTFAVNTLALFWTTRAFLPAMVERNDGHIVTIASAGGIVGTARLTDYCSSKFAAVGFDESLRLELARQHRNVRTTVVCPFYVNTGMFAGVQTRFPWLLPILQPEYVADQIVDAIRNDRQRLVLPRFVLAVYPTRLLPTGMFDAIMGFLGINKTMDEFTGRQHDEQRPAASDR